MAVFPQDNREHVLIASAPMTDFHHWSDFQDRHAMKGLMTRKLPKLWSLLFELPEKVKKTHGKASPSQLMTASEFAFADRYVLLEMGIDLRNIEILGAIVCESQRAKGFRLLFFVDEQTFSYWGRDFSVGIVEIPLPNGWHDRKSFFLSNKDKDIAAQMVDYSFGKASRGDRLEQLTDLAKLYNLKVISDEKELLSLGADERGFHHIQVGVGRMSVADGTQKVGVEEDRRPQQDSQPKQPVKPVVPDRAEPVTSTGRIGLGGVIPSAPASQPIQSPSMPRPMGPHPVPRSAPFPQAGTPAPLPHGSGPWGSPQDPSNANGWRDTGWNQGSGWSQPDGRSQMPSPSHPVSPMNEPRPNAPNPPMPLGSWESSDDFTDYEDDFTDYEDDELAGHEGYSPASDASDVPEALTADSLGSPDGANDEHGNVQDTWHGFRFDSPDDYIEPSATVADDPTSSDAIPDEPAEDEATPFTDTWGDLPVAEPNDDVTQEDDGGLGFDDSWDSFTDYDDVTHDDGDDDIEVADDDGHVTPEPVDSQWTSSMDDVVTMPPVATPAGYHPTDDRTNEVLRIANEMSAWSIRDLLGSAGEIADEVRGKSRATVTEGYVVMALALLCQQMRRNEGKLPSTEQIDMVLRLYGGQSVTVCEADRGTIIFLDAFIEALQGQQVHVISEDEDFVVESAKRASNLLAPFGLTVGQELESQPDATDRLAYKSDVIYGTPMEFGCDYLKNSMSDDYSDQTWMRLDVAIIDDKSDIIAKGDSIPLSIKGTSSTDSSDDYHKMANLVKGLNVSTNLANDTCDIVIDTIRRKVSLKPHGARLIKERAAELTLSRKYESADLTKRVQCALQAEYLLAKGRDYTVSNGSIVLLDPSTGRAMRDRKWSNGLHEAVEAKEGLQVHESGQSLATMTVSEFIALYGKAVAVS